MSGESLSHSINVLGGSRQSLKGAWHGCAGFPLRRPQVLGQRSWAAVCSWRCQLAYKSVPGVLAVAPAGSSGLLGVVCRRWFLAWCCTWGWLALAHGHGNQQMFSQTELLLGSPAETWDTAAAKDFPAPGLSDYFLFIINCVSLALCYVSLNLLFNVFKQNKKNPGYSCWVEWTWEPCVCVTPVAQ